MNTDNQTIASIQIKPNGADKVDITVNMPIWSRIGTDGKIYITLALLGGLTTFANKQEEVDDVIREAIKSFFISLDKFGKGFKQELSALGWQLNKNKIKFKISKKRITPKPLSYRLEGKAPAWNEMMKTGQSKSLSVSI